MNFNEVLEDLIIEKNLSLRQLAKESEVSAMCYSKYLNDSIPNVKNAVKIANYFKCSLDYLFGLSEERCCNFKNQYDISLFLERYNKVLTKNNITHWKFCKKFVLNESLLRHWENGDIPSISTLIVIATNLSVSIDYLVGRVDR